MTIRVTHLSQHRDNWPHDFGYDGWFLRFSGDDEEFADMRDELKTWGRSWARWTPDYRWRDGKAGAWWIDSELFRDHYTDQFEGLSEAMYAIREGDTLQWIAKRKRPAPRRKRAAYVYQIPERLQPDYTLLSVGADASLQEVKEAYRRLSKVYHPDAGGTHLGFIALQRAYEHVSQFLERIAV